MDDSIVLDAVRRSALLDALRNERHTVAELDRRLDASRSTIHRTANSFLDGGLLEKEGAAFSLTAVGRVVADEVVAFRRRMTAACRLEPLFETGQFDGVDLPLGHLADATVVLPEPNQPHLVAEAILDRIGESSSLRLLSRVVSPFYLDEMYEEALAGTRVEAVFDPAAVEILFSKYGAKSRDAARSGRFAVKIHERCPFELFVFDESVGLAAHDGGHLRVFVESRSPAVREWATEFYGRYEDESTYATVF